VNRLNITARVLGEYRSVRLRFSFLHSVEARSEPHRGGALQVTGDGRQAVDGTGCIMVLWE